MARITLASLFALTLAAVATLPAAGTDQGIRVPAGFRVGIFASGLAQPTAMAYGPDGRIYVTQNGGTLVAIRRGTRKPPALLRGFRIPLGLAWRGHDLFVSEQGRLERLTLRNGHLVDRRVLVQGPALRRAPAGQRRRRARRQAALLGQRLDL